MRGALRTLLLLNARIYKGNTQEEDLDFEIRPESNPGFTIYNYVAQGSTSP